MKLRIVDPPVLFIRNYFSSISDAGKDKAVTFGIADKIWKFISSSVSAPLLIIFLTPVLQGYYYPGFVNR